MTTPRVKGAYAGGGGGGSFEKACPDGEFIQQFSGRSGQYVDRICAKCTDGTDLGCYGGQGGSTEWNSTAPTKTGFDKISVRANEFLDNIFGYGGPGGNPQTLSCDPGYHIAGIYGRAGGWVDGLGVTCGMSKADYCVNNLEKSGCEDVSKDILNKACAKSFSQVCKDRHLEVDTPTLKSYCASNPDETYCVQFKPPPSNNNDKLPSNPSGSGSGSGDGSGDGSGSGSGGGSPPTDSGGVMSLLTNPWFLVILAALLGFFAYRRFSTPNQMSPMMQQMPMQQMPMQMQQMPMQQQTPYYYPMQ